MVPATQTELASVRAEVKWLGADPAGSKRQISAGPAVGTYRRRCREDSLMAYAGRLAQDAQRIRDELGKGMELLRTMEASLNFQTAGGQTVYAVAGVLPLAGDVVKVSFVSEVLVAAGVNTADLLADGVAIVTQFDPADDLTAGVVLEKTVLATGKGLAAGTRITLKVVTAAGSAADPPDVNVIVWWVAKLGETTYGTY